MTTSASSRSRSFRLRALVGLLMGVCGCTAILGDFEVGPAGTNPGADGGDAQVDVVADTADEQRPDAPLVAGFSNAKEVAAGARHTCALDTNGDVYCWGDNTDGQIAQPASFARATKPKKIELPSKVNHVAAGHFHTCVITERKEIFCWGRNACGQTGAGDTVTPSAQPRAVGSAVDPARTWALVAPGLDHTCAVDEGGATYCWGCNTRGQAGAIPAAGSPNPMQAGPEKNGVSVIAASVVHTCATTTSGPMCWGTEDQGALGNGPPLAETHQVGVFFGPVAEVKMLALGERHSCMRDANENILCWGDNTYGQLGLVGPEGGAPPPATDRPGGRMGGGQSQFVSAGGATTCIISSAGLRLGCVGANDKGQLGRGSVDTSPHPLVQPVFAPGKPGSELNANQVSVGRQHVCAVLPSSEVACWGEGADGQVGDGNAGGPPRAVPVFVAKPE